MQFAEQIESGQPVSSAGKHRVALAIPLYGGWTVVELDQSNDLSRRGVLNSEIDHVAQEAPLLHCDIVEKGLEGDLCLDPIVGQRVLQHFAEIPLSF